MDTDVSWWNYAAVYGRYSKHGQCCLLLQYFTIEILLLTAVQWGGMHRNTVPLSILAWERHFHKCLSCKWECWCHNVPKNILKSKKLPHSEKRKASDCVLHQLTDLDSSFWPSVMDIVYGDDALRDLYRRFHLPLASTRWLLRLQGQCRKTLRTSWRLLARTLTKIPWSTAECERGFRCVNIIMTDLRSTLLIHQVASLMFINIHRPPVCRCNPQTIKIWNINRVKHIARRKVTQCLCSLR